MAQWEREVRALQKRAFVTEFALGAGGRNMVGSRGWGTVGGLLSAQYRYLREFAQEIAAGQVSQAQIGERTKLYLASATQAFERGKASGYVGLELPCMPADGGTRCLARCRCHWDIEEKQTAWHAFYRTSAGEMYDDCRSRAATYHPYIQDKPAACVTSARTAHRSRQQSESHRDDVAQHRGQIRGARGRYRRDMASRMSKGAGMNQSRSNRVTVVTTGEEPVELDDGVRWLALLIRQGLLLIVAGIERRYRLRRDKP